MFVGAVPINIAIFVEKFSDFVCVLFEDALSKLVYIHSWVPPGWGVCCLSFNGIMWYLSGIFKGVSFYILTQKNWVLIWRLFSHRAIVFPHLAIHGINVVLYILLLSAFLQKFNAPSPLRPLFYNNHFSLQLFCIVPTDNSTSFWAISMRYCVFECVNKSL